MNKKGFTLIELLAVILILGVIALIAIPTVGGVVDSAKKGALNSTIQNIARSAEQKCQLQQLKSESITSVYKITDGKIDNQLDIKGDLPESGTIIVDNECNVMVSVDNNNISGVKDFQESEANIKSKKVGIPPESCFGYRDVQGGVEITSYDCGDGVTSISNIDGYDGFIPTYNDEGEYTDITLPNTLGGKTVVGIGEFAFVPKNYDSNTGITSIKLNSSLTYVDSYAFAANELNHIYFNDNLEDIANYAFAANKLTSITLPNSIVSILYMSFGLNKLVEMNIPSTIKTIQNGAFNGNCMPDSKAFITQIENDVVDQTRLVSYAGINMHPVIPNTITNIGYNAFFFSQISGITIPSTVTYIAEGSLNCNNFPDETAFIYQRNSDGSIDNTTLVSYAGKRRKDVIIPEGVVTIEKYSLAYSYLESVTIPNTVKYIGDYAFRYNNFKTITIPSSVLTMGLNTFIENANLTTINVNKASLANSPWGATSATINYSS